MPATITRLCLGVAIATLLAACGAAEPTRAAADAAPSPAASLAAPEPAPPATKFPGRLPEDEIVYFMMLDRFDNGDPSNDQGGLSGDRTVHGFDPTDPKFYFGGDLAGVTRRLDYIKGLGATAVWLAPVFANRPVQGEGEDMSAAHHGYWVTDFMSVDPHFGSQDEFRAFVDAAHARGLKVYLDIITNHTADIIQYRECQGVPCPYRSIADYPWTRRGGVAGEPINDGFLGDDPAHLTVENFEKLTRYDWAYTPFVPEGLEAVKNPAWLNELKYYSHRGNTTFDGENSLYGDFVGLDDINTQDPRVVQGFIDIYAHWVREYRIDGFRIDTVKHVRPEFWQAWVPAILETAEAAGVPHFHMFGEVYDYSTAHLAYWTTEGQLPTVLDFAFQGAVRDLIMGQKPAREVERVFTADPVFGADGRAARQMPVFLGNHDMGRIGGFIAEAHPDADDAEKLARSRLAHAFLMFSRGVPVIYYGDEQGFVSKGGDRGARQPMFGAVAPQYLDIRAIGTDRPASEDQFDTGHPLYQAIAQMAAIRAEHETLRRGAQVARASETEGGFIAWSRVHPDTGEEILVAFNAEETPKTVNVTVDGRSETWVSLLGTCRPSSNAAGSYTVEVPSLDVVVCKAST